MTLTLWRGDQLLGDLIPRPPTDDRHKLPTVDAFLIPAASSVVLESIWQLAHPPAFGIGVQQRAIEPFLMWPHKPAGRASSSGPVELQPMSAEAIAGVPQDVQLTVRADDGSIYLPLQLRLTELRYKPEVNVAELREVPREALINGSVWWAFINFASDADAPALHR